MDNKEFWERQADLHKNSVQAVNYDALEEELEFFFLKDMIIDGQRVCDLGCGNGRTIFELAKQKPNSVFYGADYSENMIKVANQEKDSKGIKNVNFLNLSASSDNLITEMKSEGFDVVLTKRLLINLKGEEKKKAIKNIYGLLNEKGRYLMVECFIEPLDKVNQIRALLNLERITVKPFNEYLTEQFRRYIEDLFIIEKEIDFESLYYFISRIFNAKLATGAPDYFAPINQLAIQLIKSGIAPIKGYSPEIILAMRKKT
jgi:ubiquinone/menaquinone biosynthesis C-methylase UbiE